MVITPIVGVSILILRFPFASKNEMTISQIATFDFGTIMKSSKFFFAKKNLEGTHFCGKGDMEVEDILEHKQTEPSFQLKKM